MARTTTGWVVFVCVLTISMLIVGSETTTASGGGSGKILKFDTMAGVPNGFTGATNPIRGVNGGGLPWVIERADGELLDDGSIRVRVRGLVLDPDDPAVQDAGLAGINPVPFFKAIVSCLTLDEMGQPVVFNVETGLFDADIEGDSRIRDTVDLPNPCIAPIIFVTSPGGSWFSATGF